MKAVLITGSRKWTKESVLYDRLNRLEPHLVIHGCASGADTIANDWCESTKTPVARFPADWRRWGRGAGMKRNRQMIHLLDALRTAGWDTVVYAFPFPDSIGTKGCMNLAYKAKFPVVRTTFVPFSKKSDASS